MTKVILENATDRVNAESGLIQPDQVRRIELEALVDTGATMMVLPADLVASLGLTVRTYRPARLADGSLCDVGRVTGLWIEILGRDMTGDALVVPAGAQPLIGQVQLEVLDLVVDAKSREARVNPAHPDVPILDMLGVA
jgi:clan AA aspartic protease